MLTPAEGEISYRGTKITRKTLKKLRQHIGIVFQDADNQIIASSVLAEVSFGPMNLKLPRSEVEERVNTALNYMNISQFKDRPPHYLSGGEKKRVSIADIIAMKSEIIIFDEPTASLDPLNAAMLEEVLEKLSREGKTLLLSTHDVDFAYRFADRILVFDNGRILADGTPLEVFKNISVLKQANLKRPLLLDVCEDLAAHGLFPKGSFIPGIFQNFIHILHREILLIKTAAQFESVRQFCFLIFFFLFIFPFFPFIKSSHQKCDHTNSDPGLYTKDQTFNFSRQFTSCKTFYNRSKPWFISFSFDFFYHNTARIIGTAKFCSFFAKNGTTASSTAATNRRRIVFLFFALILFPPRSQNQSLSVHFLQNSPVRSQQQR